MSSNTETDAQLTRLFWFVRIAAFVSEVMPWLFDVIFFRKSRPWRERYTFALARAWFQFKTGMLHGAKIADDRDGTNDKNNVQCAIWRFEAKRPELKLALPCDHEPR